MAKHDGSERKETAKNSEKDQGLSCKSNVGVSERFRQEKVHSQDYGLGDPDGDHGTYHAAYSSLSDLGLLEFPDSYRLDEKLRRHYSSEEEDPRCHPERIRQLICENVD